MSSSTSSIAESPATVNNMWARIVELQPIIRKCAVKMAFVYDEDAGDLEHDMMLALLDKTHENPTLLDKPLGYIFQTLKNLTHSAHRSTIQESDLDDERAACSDEAPGDELERQQRLEMVQFVLDHLDDECRALVNAILDNYDGLTSRAKCGHGISVNALAGRMGRPKSSVYRDVSRLHGKLATALAFA